MHKFVITLAGLVLSSVALVACGGNSSDVPTSNKLAQLKQQDLESAILFAESNLESLTGVGYAEWTPTTAAEELVITMNASQMLLPEEQAEFQDADIKPKEGIPYVLNEPTDSWQVVVVPDDTNQMIHIQGFGQDLETPLIEQEVPCCSY